MNIIRLAQDGGMTGSKPAVIECPADNLYQRMQTAADAGNNAIILHCETYGKHEFDMYNRAVEFCEETANAVEVIICYNDTVNFIMGHKQKNEH